MEWLIRFSMCAFYPRTAELPGLEDTGIVEFLSRFRRETNFLMWLGIMAGAVLFAVSPLFTIGVPLPAFWLPRSALERHARNISTSSIYLVRQPMFLLKMVAGLCWGAHPDVRKLFHLEPYEADPGTWRTA